MTLDEAIKYFEEMVEIGETYDVSKIVEENRQLLEWLKDYKRLLEQQSCEDAISRQAVLDLINADWKYEGLEEDVSSLPPLTPQPKTGWIPCNERLPEEREWMGTKQFGTTISDKVYVTLETPDGERFTKHLSFQNGGLSQTDQERMRVWYRGAVPIAWMPLPEPYEQQESEVEE